MARRGRTGGATVDNKHLIVWGLLGGVSLGLAALGTPQISNQAYEVKEGFLGHETTPAAKPATEGFDAQVNAAIEKYRADSAVGSTGGTSAPIAAMPPIADYDPETRPRASDGGLAAMMAQQSALAAAAGGTKTLGRANGLDVPPNRLAQTLNQNGMVINRPSSPEPVILTPSGPTTYTDGQGVTYARSGPHGAVNTTTGQFVPTN